MRIVHGQPVHGVVVDEETRCVHYNSVLDIISIKFKCCGRWFPCRDCHDETENHAAKVWPRHEFDTEAVLCGGCGEHLTIRQYLNCDFHCPFCNAQFNRACRGHYHLYFEIGDGSRE
jgi:uncharacterized CHY-type Zn-finger protein